MRDELTPEDMLVKTARGSHRAFVGQKRESEKRGLLNQPLAAAIGTAFDAQLVEKGPRETPDSALPASERVVKVQHLGDQTRTQMKRLALHPRPRGGASRG